MLERVLEPEVMDSELDALEYEAIDHGEVNREFVAYALSLCPARGELLDVGAGPGEIAVLLAEQAPGLHVTAIDLGEHMLALARRNVARAGLAHKLQIARRDAKATGYPDQHFDALVSNSLVHHLPEPGAFFREVARVLRPDGALLIRDLLRPSSLAQLEQLVARHAAGQSDYQRRLFSDSLHAALRLDEVKALCAQAGLEGVALRQSSNRHWSLERAARSPLP